MNLALIAAASTALTLTLAPVASASEECEGGREFRAALITACAADPYTPLCSALSKAISAGQLPGCSNGSASQLPGLEPPSPSQPLPDLPTPSPEPVEPID